MPQTMLARYTIGRGSISAARRPSDLHESPAQKTRYRVQNVDGVDIFYREAGLRQQRRALRGEWHEYFRRYQPPTLVVWGRGDFIFSEAGARAYVTDLKTIETHLLDAGHFALETHALAISRYIREFLRKQPAGR